MLTNLGMFLFVVSGYLILGLMSGVFLSFYKYKWKFISRGSDIIKDFTIGWAVLCYESSEVYFKKREKKLALEKSFRPLDITFRFKR